MQLLQLLQIVLFAIAGSAIAIPVSPRALPAPVDGKEARRLLSQLTVAVDVNNPTYDRKYFKHWVTGEERMLSADHVYSLVQSSQVDGNCTARQYVLKRDGTSVVTDSKCNALSGTWLSVYDDISITDPSKIDIDHIVPLKEAWVSGARHWNDQKREAFANDIKLPQLVAASQRSNRAKGDKGKPPTC
ncbi:unnamed protein product [Cyclocybe aegerita]|uniref:GmrSD restriction endonucleases C-terminal domain-containing protein n=1 Tax=Cyclocybe aegerita TaxID=1973307 RepID=A0A8S0X738_CYCAE|nr:unnamed protein product [Cyclocybe aegerita]